MNSPEQNNYIQYVNQFGVIKTKSVVFTKGNINTTFEVSGINESFFILSVFQNNIKVNGVGFDDLENNDMLAFINSNLFDLSTIPSNAFLNSEQVVTMSYNNEYVKTLTSSAVQFPEFQNVYVHNFPANQNVNVQNFPAVQTVKFEPELVKSYMYPVLSYFDFPTYSIYPNTDYNYSQFIQGYESILIRFDSSINMSVKYQFDCPQSLRDNGPYYLPSPISKVLRYNDLKIQITNLNPAFNLFGYLLKFYINYVTNQVIICYSNDGNDAECLDNFNSTNIDKGFSIEVANEIGITVTKM